MRKDITRNYGLFLFEQEANTIATKEDIEKFKEDESFLIKIKNIESTAARYRQTNKLFKNAPFEKSLMYGGKKLKVYVSGDGEEIYIMPDTDEYSNMKPKKYLEVTGDKVGYSSLSKEKDSPREKEETADSSLYKSDKIDYKEIVISLEGLLNKEDDVVIELAFFIEALRSTFDAHNFNFSEIIQSINTSYGEVHGNKLVSDLSEIDFEPLDKKVFDLSIQAELGEIPGNARVTPQLKKLDLSNSLSAAKLLRDMIKRGDEDNFYDSLMIATVVSCATHKQLVEIDNILQDAYGKDLFDWFTDVETKSWAEDDFTMTYVRSKLARVRRSKYWAGTQTDSEEEGSFSKKVGKYIKGIIKKKDNSKKKKEKEKADSSPSPLDVAAKNKYNN